MPRYALDLGNTRLKLACFEGEALCEIHTYPRSRAAAALAWLSGQDAEGYVLLSTGTDDSEWLRVLGERGPVYVPRGDSPAPLELAYATPDTLGADRLAAAVGAAAIYPACDCLVIDAGTCLTCEWVTAGGVYLGGSIAPGLDMRLAAMATFTGKLPRVARAWPETTVGTSTTSALQAGALTGALLELRGWIRTFRATYPNGRLLLCGGDAPFLRPRLPDAVLYRPSLVLEGLVRLQAYAAPKT